jgi:Tfp pilus assembly protein PilF
MHRLRQSLRALGVFALLLIAYSNHFRNGFHFDDTHAIVDNPAVRDVRNIPRYFRDATTFSVLPPNQSFRPVLQSTLAIDYRVAGGYRPLTFQISTFVWFTLLVVLIYLLFVAVVDKVSRDRHANRSAALLASALFALHPLCAETVNYVIQRGEILSTVGVVGMVTLYARAPAWRRFGLYLLPLVFGALAKPPALIAPAILVVYGALFDAGQPSISATTFSRWVSGFKSAMPSIVVVIGLGVWIQAMTPPTYVSGAAAPIRYWLTQPFVIVRYVGLVLAPIDLSADNDWTTVAGVADPRVAYGVLFVTALVWLAIRASRRDDTRPIAFGVWWFLLTIVPTSVTPLAEVANDHRVFLPLVGVAFAAAWTFHLVWQRAGDPRTRAAGAAAVVLVLVACTAGVYARNEVWRTEESLWYDVTVKSPTNGRGLMNYGLARMERGDYTTAIAYFQRALVYSPSYSLAHINLAIAYGGVGRPADAEREFNEGVTLAPMDSRSRYYYGRWLRSVGRTPEAIVELGHATRLNPADPLAQQELHLALRDQTGGPDQLLSLSLAAYQSGQFRECIALAEQALELRPGFAEAYNNIAAGHNAMAEWDAGIAAAERAVQLKPDLALARGNLQYARDKKRGVR